MIDWNSNTPPGQAFAVRRYGLTLVPNTGTASSTGTWSPRANMLIIVDWLPSDTPLYVQGSEPSGEDPSAGSGWAYGDQELAGWLRVAEGAFDFWNNPEDDGWDQL